MFRRNIFSKLNDIYKYQKKAILTCLTTISNYRKRFFYSNSTIHAITRRNNILTNFI